MALDPQRQIKRIRGSVPARKKRGDNAQDVKLYDALRIPRETKKRLDELKEKLETAIFSESTDSSPDFQWYDRHLRYEEFMELLYLAAAKVYRVHLLDAAPVVATGNDIPAEETEPMEQTPPEEAPVSEVSISTEGEPPAKKSKRKKTASKEQTGPDQEIGKLFEL